MEYLSIDLYDKCCQSYKLLIFLKLGRSCVLILLLSADPILTLHRTNRTGKPILRKVGWIGKVTSLQVINTHVRAC